MSKSEVEPQSILIIEDDDGFTTRWSWPQGRTILANAAEYAQLRDMVS